MELRGGRGFCFYSSVWEGFVLGFIFVSSFIEVLWTYVSLRCST